MGEVFESTFFRLTIDDDIMRAEMLVLEPEKGKEVTVAMALDFLLENEIKMGVDKEKLTKIIEQKVYSQPFTVATGKPSVDGENGWFEFLFDTKIEAKPQEKGDGSVDYYNTKLFEEVSIGDKLVIYHPATKGEFGFNIKGKFLMPKRGKELSVIKGKGFSVSDDKLTYTAEACGKIEYKYGEINISDMYVVEGDLDMTVGNIRFSGDVKVRGDVASGMIIEALGNVEIQGHVAGATIKAGKDILLKKGVQGAQKAYIEAKGNIYGQFFEECNINCDKSLEANYLLNCNTCVKGKINIRGKKGVVVGGRTHGMLGIEIHDGGNDTGTPTILQVGISDEIMKEYAEIAVDIKKIDEELEPIERGVAKLAMIKETTGLSEHEKAYTKMLQAKIIKNAEKKKKLEKRKALFELINKAHVSYIGVHGKLSVGVQLEFEAFTKKITAPFYNSMFKIIDGDVGVLPFDL